jgi:DNA-binding MarR family transcriptional regulator
MTSVREDSTANKTSDIVSQFDELMVIIERLNADFGELIKSAVDPRDRELHDLQLIMLYRIGDRSLSIGELTSTGCYTGTNVSYNVKQLRDKGYLTYTPSATDRRIIYIELSACGRRVHDAIAEAYSRFVTKLQRDFDIEVGPDNLCFKFLRKVQSAIRSLI